MTEAQNFEELALAEALKALDALDIAGLDAVVEAAGHRKAAIQAEGKRGAIERIHAIAASLGMKAVELLQSKAYTPRAPRTAKYRDPATGAEWSGMGRRPGWVIAAGDGLEKFAI